ncbi:translation initiation factor IF-2-like [Dermacentor silvarum]|uniref:translation initiation factor IF-2-like n=1 Tax=Dermacentor silvarum TaxID=543639 RepID=UPI0021011FD2|nr:translation initiation factor IF-2-like [Dermacentor silvarum]
MAIKPRAVMVQPSSGTTTAAANTFARDTQRPAGLLSLASKPRAVPVCPSAATKTAADTKFAREAPVRPSAARKGVQQPQVGSTSGASKHARGMPSAPTVAKRPADRPTPAVPEPRRPLGPPAGQTGASKRNLRPVGGATSGPARGPAARLSTAAKAPRPLLSAPRRTLNEHGFLDVEAMDNDVFYRMFRFEKIDFRDLVSTLQIPEEVVSAQRVRVSGNEALCITLRRLAYPNRLCELELLFNRHSSVLSSVVSTVLAHIEYHFDHLLADLTTHQWLNLLAIENFSEVNTNGIHKSAHHT